MPETSMRPAERSAAKPNLPRMKNWVNAAVSMTSKKRPPATLALKDGDASRVSFNISSPHDGTTAQTWRRAIHSRGQKRAHFIMGSPGKSPQLLFHVTGIHGVRGCFGDSAAGLNRHRSSK